jgi:uncharacterized membrane protein
MEPAVVVLLLVGLFAATHIGLATNGIRGRLVAALGERGFFGLYSLIASLTFWALVAYYAAHRFTGMPGLDAGGVALVRWLGMAVILAGTVIAVMGLAGYPRTPYALFGRAVPPPWGIQRITRHPFFVGMAMIGAAHVLLAPRLAGAVLMGGLAMVSIAGARHQDTKHLRRHGQAYAEYLAETSLVPFAAVLAGRQRVVWSELPLGAAALGLGAGLVLRMVHDGLFAHGGLWIVVGVTAGGALATIQSVRYTRRAGRAAQRERRLA